MLKKITSWFSLIVILLLIVLAVVNRGRIKSFYFDLFNQLPSVEKIADKIGEKTLQEIKKQVNTPPPLWAKIESPQSFLTVAGVIEQTNLQRENNGLPPLSENSLLNQSAAVKAQDMFDKQYFAHDSPEGIGVSQLAEIAGYQYIMIGENLALGNFLNDKVLVEAWMDSSGHRANILNSRYQNIGVAVKKGIYQGKTTWIAVQHFGLPLSACPQPDDSLKQKITDNKAQLDQLENELETKFSQLESTKPEEDPQYNQKIDDYNNLVNQYNTLVAETKNLIEEYNRQVASFNQCIQ